MKKLLIFIPIILIGCNNKLENPYNYCGGEIVSKNTNFTCYFRIRYEGEITEKVYVTGYDYDKFDLGDIILCDEEN